MNTLKKMLVTATMVVTLGATTSCGNKDNQPNFVGGLPYTLFVLDHLVKGIEYEVKFECEGDPEVYWDSETPTHEKSHKFISDSNDYYGKKPVVLIKGNIDSLQFCDASGALLADGNAKISSIIFSNTITKLPECACYSLEFSRGYNNGKTNGSIVYLPASIKTIGKNAFFPSSTFTRFVCEPTSRPTGWDPNWCTVGEFARFMRWGLSYYITDNYDMYYIVNDNPIHTACYEGTLREDVTNLEIPETINVNNFECQVVSMASMGNSKETLESVTIPKSVVVMDEELFHDHVKLKNVKFADEYEYLLVGSQLFWGCFALENITLPKGLINIPNKMFDACTNLTSVVVPNTVKTVGSSEFYGAQSETLTIDLTSYTDSNQIATCSDSMLDDCKAGTVTFKISSSLSEDKFIDKGWPKTDGSGTPKVVWEKAPTLNA